MRRSNRRRDEPRWSRDTLARQSADPHSRKHGVPKLWRTTRAGATPARFPPGTVLRVLARPGHEDDADAERSFPGGPPPRVLSAAARLCLGPPSPDDRSQSKGGAVLPGSREHGESRCCGRRGFARCGPTAPQRLTPPRSSPDLRRARSPASGGAAATARVARGRGCGGSRPRRSRVDGPMPRRWAWHVGCSRVSHDFLHASDGPPTRRWID